MAAVERKASRKMSKRGRRLSKKHNCALEGQRHGVSGTNFCMPGQVCDLSTKRCRAPRHPGRPKRVGRPSNKTVAARKAAAKR